MPLVHRSVAPVNCSDGKLELKGKYECEFIAVNNETLVNVFRQLAALVDHAADIFSETATLTDQVGRRIRAVKLRLDELEAKTELFDPKLVPVPEGSLDDVSITAKFTTKVVFDTKLFDKLSRPRFLGVLFDKAGNHCPAFPPRSPITTLERNKLNTSSDNRRPASFAALRDWKLDDYLDEKIATLDKKKQSVGELNRALAAPFPSQLVQVDVTGQGFDRMRKSRRSLVIHTKRIKRSKRRNTICGSMPNKECGIQTSFSSVNFPNEEETVKKYGIDSGHWSSCTTSSAQEGNGPRSTVTAPSPWDPATSISTSSDFLFDDEDRCLTPQLEHFTDGLVSDSDSVDTDGYFTSFRSDCGFPKSKKSPPEEDGKDGEDGLGEDKQKNTSMESEYDLFGKGSTSTTASSCGTVVLRGKPNPPTRTSSTGVTETGNEQQKARLQVDDAEWEERVKRKSLIELVPSLVVVTPSPTLSCSESPPPLKDPSISEDGYEDDSDPDSGRITPKAEDFSTISECGTISDTDSEMRSELRPASTASSTGSGNSTMTLTSAATTTATALPQPDVIPDVQVIRTKGAPKLDVSREYFSLDTVLLNSSVEEERRLNGDIKTKHSSLGSGSLTGATTISPSGTLERVQSPPSSATSGKLKGARVVLDANGEIIFASETLRRKRRPKVSFDPGFAVKTMDYDNFASTYGRIRESVYDRIIKKDVEGKENEKLYECIEEIRKQNLRHPYLHLQEEKSIAELHSESMRKNNSLEVNSDVGHENGVRCSSSSSNCSSVASSRYASRPPLSPPKDEDVDKIRNINNKILLLETDLDSAIPPSMPDLKNLPKIKDRLKRNESYRIANTDEDNKTSRHPPTNPNANNSNPRPSLLSLISPQLRMNVNNKLNRRMSFASSKDNSPNGNLHLNKKRDILEEDPIFIQQILNLSSANAGRKSPCNATSTSPGSSAYSSRITLSKLALSPEDRPTFLRRENDDISHDDDGPVWMAESPPTMDEIAKEIYRFRKKFNIQPNATSRNLLPSQMKLSTLDRNGNLRGNLRNGGLSPTTSLLSPPPQLDRNGNVRKTTSPLSTIPLGFPKLQVQLGPPLSSSTPIKSANTVNNNAYYSTNPVSSSRVRTSTSNPVFLSRPMSSLSNSSYNSSITPDNSFIRDATRGSCRNYGPPPTPPIRNFSSSGRKIFPSNPGAYSPSASNDYLYPNRSRNAWGGGGLGQYRRNSMSLAEPSPGSLNLGARTSLSDFKKLLQAAKPKRSSISAMEALKPKIIGVESTL